jgi:predicted RNase H-like HicB family nuclease
VLRSEVTPKQPEAKSPDWRAYFLTLKEITMIKRTYFTAIALAATLAGGQAFAADTSTGKTRDQVRAELKEAVRTGNIIGNSESGRMRNDINPSQYPAQPTTQGNTRAEVTAELKEAVRTGNIIGNSESGRMRNEINPSQYPAQPMTQGNTRAEVLAELKEAIRTGNMPANDESGLMLNEVNPGKYDRIS